MTKPNLPHSGTGGVEGSLETSQQPARHPVWQGIRVTDHDVACPVCGTGMVPGFLEPRVQMGAINFLFGFSIGTKAGLWWLDGDGLGGRPLPHRKRRAAYRCADCGRILFEPDA